MASVRGRGGKYTGLYRDKEGLQRSAGSYGDRKTALQRAEAAEAAEQVAKMVGCSRATLYRHVDVEKIREAAS